METRINPITKKLERKLQPLGLPPLWASVGFCDKCEPFGECLGLSALSEDEFFKIEIEIKNAIDYKKSKDKIISEYQLILCT